MTNWQFRFTVFTPTFNRAHTLKRVFDSLSQQTFRDFEWLIVDDGSTDNTEQLVNQWSSVASFPIVYIKQPNGGKHSAFHTGVKAARGEFFLCLDSDDSCTPEALDRFDWHWRQIMDSSVFTGVTCLCKDQFGNLVGDKFPEDVFDSDSLEIVHRYRIGGEKWGFHRTEIMREYPFPQAPASTCVGEGIIWARIARRYRTRFINEALRLYYQEPNGRITTRPLRQQAESAPYYLLYIQENMDWLMQSPRYLAIALAQYNRFTLHSKAFKRGLLGCFQNQSIKVAFGVLLMAPVGICLFIIDKIRRAP